MPLVLEFKQGDKIIVNGAVLENGGHPTQLVIHNDVAILRGKDILAEEHAVTPAARVYFALQCAYIFPEKRADYLAAFSDRLQEYITACPSAGSIADSIQRKLSDGVLYGALRATRKLIDHEKKLLKDLGLAVEKPKAEPSSPRKR